MRPGTAGILFILPALLLYLLFVGVPIAQVVVYSFFAWDSGTVTGFAGLENYVRLFQDAVFWTALGHNLIWVALTLAIPLAAGLLLAAILAEKKVQLVRILGAVYFIPRTIPLVVAGIIWGWIYNPIFGLLNDALKAVGLGRFGGAWLADPDSALLSLNVVGAWTFFGFCVVIYLAAIQNIDPQLYEAARVDGASWRQQFRFVTVPALRATTLFLGLFSAIEAMRFFDLVWVTTKGGPGHATEVLTTHIYKSFFLIGDFGYAAALSVVLLVIVISLASAAFWMLRSRT
jgi:raffinose/stachyose/melibiose transport system permease protein